MSYERNAVVGHFFHETSGEKVFFYSFDGLRLLFKATKRHVPTNYRPTQGGGALNLIFYGKYCLCPAKKNQTEEQINSVSADLFMLFPQMGHPAYSFCSGKI